MKSKKKIFGDALYILDHIHRHTCQKISSYAPEPYIMMKHMIFSFSFCKFSATMETNYEDMNILTIWSILFD